MAADKRTTTGRRPAIAADGAGVSKPGKAGPGPVLANPVLAHLALALDAHLRSGVPGGMPPMTACCSRSSPA